MRKQVSLTNVVMFICIVVLVVFIFYNKEPENEKILEQRAKIEKLDSIVNNSLHSIDSIIVQVDLRDSVIDSLREVTEINAIKLENEKRKINRINKKFRTFPDTVRDSIIRAYIRANQ